MSEPDGIQKEPSPPARRPSGIQPVPSPPNVAVPAVEFKNCPHCDEPLTAEDVARGQCWFCDKRLTAPVEPKRPQTPFLATFLLGLVGATLGIVVGYMLTRENIGQGSWTVSLCGGIGFATGSAVARSIFDKRK